MWWQHVGYWGQAKLLSSCLRKPVAPHTAAGPSRSQKQLLKTSLWSSRGPQRSATQRLVLVNPSLISISTGGSCIPQKDMDSQLLLPTSRPRVQQDHGSSSYFLHCIYFLFLPHRMFMLLNKVIFLICVFFFFHIYHSHGYGAGDT